MGRYRKSSSAPLNLSLCPKAVRHIWYLPLDQTFTVGHFCLHHTFTSWNEFRYLSEVFPQEENFKGAAASSSSSSACVSDFSACRSSSLTTLNVLLGLTEIIPCNGNATNCGHGCLMTDEGSVCVCPEGSLLQDNGDGCTGTAYKAVIGSYVSVNY